MKLAHRVWIVAAVVLAMAMTILGILSYRQAGDRVEAEVLKTSQTLRDVLMTVRYTYHQRFLDSGLPLNDQTLGFLPAHAMSAISSDFERFHKLGIRFRNVSDRARNPDNRADAAEMAAMGWFRANPEARERLTKIEPAKGESYFLYATPIRIEPYCLGCHGEAANAPASVRQRYDAGYGYRVGDLRGVLAIRVPTAAAEASVRAAVLRDQLSYLAGFLLAGLVGGVLMHRLVIRRLQHFKDGALSLARGDYATRLDTAGPDEIAELADAFNQMAAAIRQRDESLRMSERDFRALVQNIPGAVYRCRFDADWSMVFMSDHIEALCGYPSADFTGGRARGYASLIHADDVAQVDRAVRDAVAARVPFNLEYRIRHADGGTRWMFERGRAVYDERGEVTWLEGVISDVTSRKRAQGALESTADFVSRAHGDEFFTALVRHTAAALRLDYVHVALLTPERLRVETVAAWLDGEVIANWGYDLADTPCGEVLSLERRCIEHGVRALYPRDKDLVRIAAEGYLGEPLVSSSGEAIGLIVGISRARLEEAGVAQANLRILAARAAAECEQREALRALREANARSQNYLDTVEAIIVALDREGRITLINRKGCQLLGRDEHELLGQDWFATCLPRDENLEAVRAVFRKALANDMAGAEYFENPVRGRDGETRLIAWHNSVLRDAAGVVIGGLSAGEDITERRRQELALQESEARVRAIADNATSMVVFMKDTAGRYLFVNRQWLSQFHLDEREVLGKTDLELFPGEIGEAFRANDRRVLDLGRALEVEEQAPHDDGMHYYQSVKFPLRRSGGEIYAVAGIAVDYTERRRAEQALRDSENMFHTMVDWTFDWEYWVLPDGRFHYMTPSVERVTGYRAEDFVHNPALIDAIVHAEDRYLWERHSRTHLPEGASVESAELEMRIIGKQGDTRWVAHTCRPVFDPDGRYQGRRVTVRDITARKLAEDQIRHLAYFDPLTGLPNRRLLLDRLGQALIASDRGREFGAVLMLDLDHFKTLNDTLGHDVGDHLLIEVAQRLSANVRQADTVARLGGDEFVVMLEGLGEDEVAAANQAEAIAEKVREALNASYALAGVEQEYHSTPSIGLTLFRDRRTSVDVLLKQADVAMYQAKDAGRNAVRFFNPAMQAAIESRAELEAALRRAIQQDELRLHYQPQVGGDGRVIGVEALLRWSRPHHGLVAPASFIPLAEETGLIVPIGQWVLDTACAQLKAWRADPRTRALKLAINVSGRQFHQSDFVARVTDALARAGADPSLLELELTESVVLENVGEVIARMRALRDLGVGFAMDDFGTGYSSLSYLKRLPLDKLKIDQSFVRDISDDPNDAAIVRAILAMSDSLGLRVIAEGVETREQHDFLRRHGCDAFQGYLYGRPMPIDELEAGL